MNISWQVMLRPCSDIACQISVAVQLDLFGVGAEIRRYLEARERLPIIEISQSQLNSSTISNLQSVEDSRS
jgi:hypothetical protein